MVRTIAGKDMPRTLAVALLLAGMAGTAPAAHAADPADSMEPRLICAELTETAERLMGLPRMLLHAVSLAESGRWNAKAQANTAWPWTVYAEGRGRYYPSREAAMAEIEALRARGVKNIDVGCMQVNLIYHGDNFDSVAQALDPVHNVAYAARHLKNLRIARRSWAAAVTHYHSGTPEHGRPYWRRVFALWNEERRRDFRARREARIDAAQATRIAHRIDR
jgi:soluble lytic murein transglycosylase-like protein